MALLHLLVVLNLTFSAMLTGLIWIIQIVHYPGFLRVGAHAFPDYHHHHTQSISYVVIPLMLSELAVSIVLPLVYLPNISWLVYSASGMVLLLWLITLLKFAPLHGKLTARGYDELLIRQLVRANWIRTIVWSIRTIILCYLEVKVLAE